MADEKKPERYGLVIGLKPDQIEKYKEIHAAVWPGVLQRIKDCRIGNYSIFLTELEGRHYLFAYFEYRGDDFAADMKKMAADTETIRWWKVTDPMQEPLPGRQEGDWWLRMEEVFHTE